MSTPALPVTSVDQLAPAQQPAAPAPSIPTQAPAPAQDAQPAQAPTPAQAPAPAQAPLPPEHRWLGVVKGVLEHLEGAAQGLAVGGIPGAVVGAVDPKRPKAALASMKANASADLADKQSKAQWQSAQAAEGMAREAMYRAQVEQMPKQFQETLKKDDEAVVKNLVAGGIRPIATTAGDTKEELDSAREQIKEHGGVPALFHFGDGYAVFDVHQLSDGPMLDQTRQMLSLTRPGAQLTSQEWNNPQQWPKQMKDKATGDALHFFDPTDPKQLERYQGYLNTVDKTWSDDNPDKKPVLDKLKQAVTNLQGMRSGAFNEKLTLARDAAKARGMAINENKPIQAIDPTTGVERVMPAGEAFRIGAVGPAQFNKIETEYIKPAADAEKSYQMFQQAFKDFKAGTKTGAESMVALSQHLATTFGSVKGARITKDMIEEHLGARGISDKALVATQKLTNGDVLSADQWDAFRSLITASRRLAWGNAATQANAIGVNIRSRVPKDLGGSAQSITNPAASMGDTPATSAPTSTDSSNPMAKYGGVARQPK